MKRRLFIVILFTVLIATMGCDGRQNDEKNQDEFVSKTDFYLDTVVDIKIYHPNDNSEAVIDKAMDRIGELEQILSVHIKGSDLWNIKENAGIKPVKVSQETIEVMKLSKAYSELTGGLFDVTIGPLVDLWAIDPPEGHVPTKEELDIVLPKIDYKKIAIDEEKGTVFLKDKGMIANLGAIAKGYIADEVKEVLLENHVEHAVINLGGNVLLVGGKSDNTDFKIGVQDPDAETGAYLGTITANDISIVSSGDYQRYFEVDGKKYHHILNPTTGYPADNNVKQVTILSKNSGEADGLSTSTFLMGLEDGMALVESLDHIEAIFVTKDNVVHLSSGIGDQFIFDEVNYGDKYTVEK